MNTNAFRIAALFVLGLAASAVQAATPMRVVTLEPVVIVAHCAAPATHRAHLRLVHLPVVTIFAPGAQESALTTGAHPADAAS